ncbi:unnamed protein product [Cylicocyclus nassatus]|uniref:Uncharacterized protein n=1 Tax=Cylicocyclus nassatus TaxID=53992 RepID=A0AA36GJY3_CYLNA|nr:unnamed protein product [Cylicocyclus nassatus]
MHAVVVSNPLPILITCIKDVRINYSGETATLNCPDNYRLKIRYGDGKIQGDVTVKQFKANFQIYCLDGRWGVFNKDESAKKDVSSGEEITGLACHKGLEAKLKPLAT